MRTHSSTSVSASGIFLRGQGEKGFSLVELMVTLAILGIMVGIATAAILTSMPEMRLNSAVRELLVDVRRARSAAAKEGVPYFLCATGNTTYEVARIDDVDTATDCDGAGVTTIRTVDMADSNPGVEFGYIGGTGECALNSVGAANDAVMFPSDRATFNTRGSSVLGPDQLGMPLVPGGFYLTNPESDFPTSRCVHVFGPTGNPVAVKWDGADWNLS